MRRFLGIAASVVVLLASASGRGEPLKVHGILLGEESAEPGRLQEVDPRAIEAVSRFLLDHGFFLDTEIVRFAARWWRPADSLFFRAVLASLSGEVDAVALAARVLDRGDPLQDRVELAQRDLAAVARCPGNPAAYGPQRVVLQVIENVFHRWREYDLPDGTVCIVLEAPEDRILSAAEARLLLAASAQRLRSPVGPSDEWYVVAPDDPSLAAPPALPPPHDAGQEVPRHVGPDRSSPMHRLPPPSELPREPRSEGIPEVVIGDDDRVRVTNTTAYPWNTIGYAFHRYPDDSTWRCTGFLVSPHTILTNGHCVRNPDRGGWVTQWDYYPGQTQASAGASIERPYGSRSVATVATNQQYIDTPGCDFDYAATFIETPFSQITTYMPLVFNVSDAPNINLAGYPREVQGETNSSAMWRSYGPVINQTDRRIFYGADTSGGNSGGPVWLFSEADQSRRVIAVHACGAPSGNSGPRLMPHNQALIEQWMQWTPTSCTYSISPASRSHTSSAATGTVSVSTQAGCAWTAVSNSGWISVTSGSSGSGSGNVSYSITANTSANSRTGTLTIAGKTFTVTQAAGHSCAYSLSPTIRSHTSAAATGTVSVTTQAGCNWTAVSNAGWISVTSGSSGSGSGSLGYSITANTSASQRTGTLTIAGQTFTITQAGSGSPPPAGGSTWVEAVIHLNPGSDRWRSDVGVLNAGNGPATINFRVYLESGGTVEASSTNPVPAGGQALFVDLLGQLQRTDKGSLELWATQPIIVTSRTYNAKPEGTFGQFYDGYISAQGLSAGQSAFIPQLRQDANFRTNISVTNTGTGNASVELRLYTANGTQVWSNTRNIAPGRFHQWVRPFERDASPKQTNMLAGYARITVTGGSGVLASGSVIDGRTGDPTTIPAKLAP